MVNTPYDSEKVGSVESSEVIHDELTSTMADAANKAIEFYRGLAQVDEPIYCDDYRNGSGERKVEIGQINTEVAGDPVKMFPQMQIEFQDGKLTHAESWVEPCIFNRIRVSPESNSIYLRVAKFASQLTLNVGAAGCGQIIEESWIYGYPYRAIYVPTKDTDGKIVFSLTSFSGESGVFSKEDLALFLGKNWDGFTIEQLLESFFIVRNDSLTPRDVFEKRLGVPDMKIRGIDNEFFKGKVFDISQDHSKYIAIGDVIYGPDDKENAPRVIEFEIDRSSLSVEQIGDRLYRLSYCGSIETSGYALSFKRSFDVTHTWDNKPQSVINDIGKGYYDRKIFENLLATFKEIEYPD